MKIYDKGDVVRCSGAFTDSDGTAQDPTAVFFKWKTPAAVTTTYTYGSDVELVKDSVGNYYVDLDIDEVGNWHYRFYSTGTGQAAGDGEFEIRTTEF